MYKYLIYSTILVDDQYLVYFKLRSSIKYVTIFYGFMLRQPFVKLVTYEKETCASFRASFYVYMQYPSNMTPTHNHRNLPENLREFLARESPALQTGKT